MTVTGIIESILVEYLSEQLEIRVVTEKPDDNPQRYVLIEKTGSAKRNYIDMATVAIQSYAESMFEAAVLNERVKQAMEGIITLPTISNAELNSDYNFTDTAKKEYRYQAVYDITFL